MNAQTKAVGYGTMMGDGQFGTYIKVGADMEGGIGLTHVTDCANLEGIVASQKLEARHCSVFDKNILYLFYGKPAYRRKWDGESTSNLGFARVCFILKDEVSAQAARMLPFDSGAFFGRYRHAFHDMIGVEAFDVDPAIHPRKIIAAFYHSFSDYFWMQPIAGLKFPLTKTIVDSYYKLITGGLKEAFDDRCATIELQYRESLPLAGHVAAVIAPNQMFEDPELLALIHSWGAEPRGYMVPHMFNPSEIGGRLYDEVNRYLIDAGLIT